MAHAQAAHHDEHHTPSGWRRFVYSTNHKDIGTMYLVFAMCGGLIGGFMSVAMRMELQFPGMQIFHDSHQFNVFTTAHGLPSNGIRAVRADAQTGAGSILVATSYGVAVVAP